MISIFFNEVEQRQMHPILRACAVLYNFQVEVHAFVCVCVCVFTHMHTSQLLALQTERAMAPHSSTLAWKISWMEEPGRLQSMGPLSRTQLSNFTFTFHFHALEKEMATRSSVLVWRIPGTVEPDGLPSWGLAESDTTEATWQQQQQPYK